MIPKLCKYSNPARQSEQGKCCQNVVTLENSLDHHTVKCIRMIKNGSFQISLMISWHQKSQCGKICGSSNHFDDVRMIQEAEEISKLCSLPQ